MDSDEVVIGGLVIVVLYFLWHRGSFSGTAAQSTLSGIFQSISPANGNPGAIGGVGGSPGGGGCGCSGAFQPATSGSYKGSSGGPYEGDI